MEEKTKKRCTKCKLDYYIQALNSEANKNIPLFLSCGHSMCEVCVKNYVALATPVECAVCQLHTEVSPENLQLLMQKRISLYSVFPVNTYMVGEISLHALQDKNDDENDPINEFFINIEDMLKFDSNKGECVQCRKLTSFMCKECDLIVCKDCFTKSHNYALFQRHELRGIVPRKKLKNSCTSHQNKRLEYYCKDCCKPICMNCFMVNGGEACHGHFIVSIHDENEDLFTQLEDIMPRVDELFRRLTNTAVDIGNSLTILTDDSSTTAYSTLMGNIDAHFSKLNSIIQQQKHDITQQVLKNKIAEIDSLKKAKDDVTELLIKAKTLLNSVGSLERDELQQEDVTTLLEEAKALANAPWCLRQQGVDQRVDVIIKEDVYASLNDYIQLEGRVNSEFKLINTQALIEAEEEIPQAPTSVVWPSTDIEDVGQEPLNSPTTLRRLRLNPALPEFSGSSSNTSFDSNDTGLSQEAIQIRESSPEEEPQPMGPLPESSDQEPFKEGERSPEEEPQPMGPLPESSYQEPFEEGWKEIVYISHIENPNNFYVQRAGQLSQVKHLKEEFKKGIFYDIPPEQFLTEGKILLAYNFQERFWQRCRIVSVEVIDGDVTVYNVFCFDFGNNETVEIESLRYVPPGRIESPPPLAINCSLADCEPIDGSWTNNDTLLMESIIDNKQAVIHVKKVQFLPTGIMQVECNITTFEDSISMAHALDFHGRARIPHDLPHPTAQMLAVWKKPKIYINDYKNSIEHVLITHIACLEHFFVRKLILQRDFTKLCGDLEKEYRFTIKADIIHLPEKSMVCVAHVQDHELGTRWARAVVLELLANTTVRVFLTDIGAILELHWRNLRRIHKKFLVQLGYATECRLIGVTARDSQRCHGATKLLKRFQNKPLEMHVKDIDDRGSLGIKLYDKNDNRNICINDEMVKNQFAVYIGYNENIDANNLGFDKERTQNMKLEVNILTYESPSRMYVSFLHSKELYEQLFNIINFVCSNNKTEGKIDWKVGDKCCTIYNMSQTWRRAVILELENKHAKVFYYDFASVETVPVLNLREIDQRLAVICGAAVLCHLHGVIPAQGEEWPPLTKLIFKGILNKYNEFFVTKGGPFKGKSLPIELWVTEAVAGRTLEPNDREWLSLNKQIIDKGLGIPDEQETVTCYRGCSNESFYKIGEDSVLLSPVIISCLKNAFKELSGEASSAPAEIDPSNEWLPPEPLPTNELTAMPTHISHNGVIYLHDITQKDTLDLIHKVLEVCFTRPDPEAKFAKWTIGEPCIALCSVDNRFYRGKVLKLNDNTSTCLIQYIDYGNEELVAFENIRKSNILYQIPTLAHKCLLDRIRPVNNHWNTQSLDYISKSIIRKPCYVKVSGSPIGGLITIEIKYNNMCINDHLVSSNMALYVDESAAQNLEQSNESASALFDPTTASVSFYKRRSYDDNDWVQILRGEERQYICNNSITYSPYTKSKFKCYVNVLNEPEKLELTTIHDAETVKIYENMFKELQSEGKNMQALTSIYKNKACVVQSQVDNQWYRASILQYSGNKKHLKVKYVDFGNVEIVSVADVKEISKKYAKLPPSTLTVTLQGVKVNPNIKKDTILEYYKRIFFDKVPFVAEVINGSNIIPSVELKNDDGQLIYESLIEQNILINCD